MVQLLKCTSGKLGWETGTGWHSGEYDTCGFLRCLRDIIILRTMDWDDWHNRCIRKKKIEALKVVSHQYSTKNENQRTSLTTIREVSSLAAEGQEKADSWVQNTMIRAVGLQRRLHLQPYCIFCAETSRCSLGLLWWSSG